jgi:hypothetical protein
VASQEPGGRGGPSAEGSDPTALALVLAESATVSKVTSPIMVVLEVTPKRSFASAIEWPGWTRSGRTPEAALETLAAYADRYRAVATAAGLTVPTLIGLESFHVVEEIEGDATTSFGAPSKAATLECQAVTAREAGRVAVLLDAAWTVLDQVVSTSPAELRKGPRGGGRDRDAIFEHVLGAEQAYAGKLGVRVPQPSRDDTKAIRAMREALLVVVRGDRTGQPARDGGWTPRYSARRLAWHALDHAWEVQDRSS